MRLHLTEKEQLIAEYVKHIVSNVFQFLLFAFLLILLAKEFYPKIINSYVNINWFMIIVIILGAISIIFPPKKENKEEGKPKKSDFVLIIFLGVIGAILIYLKLRNLGWISYVISILGGFIIIILSWLLLTEKDNEKKLINV